jgi:hypothetical protein
VITQTPKEFDFPIRHLPPQFHYAGSFYDNEGREPVPFPWEKLTRKPLIYASMLGTDRLGSLRLLSQGVHAREEAGTQRYNVGIDTLKLCATSRGGVPLANSFLAAWILPSVIWRFLPPTRPWRLAASSPARVRSIMSSRSIWARLAITWKKKRPAVVLLSMPSVMLWKCTFWV